MGLTYAALLRLCPDSKSVLSDWHTNKAAMWSHRHYWQCINFALTSQIMVCVLWCCQGARHRNWGILWYKVWGLLFVSGMSYAMHPVNYDKVMHVTFYKPFWWTWIRKSANNMSEILGEFQKTLLVIFSNTKNVSLTFEKDFPTRLRHITKIDCIISSKEPCKQSTKNS